MEEMIEMLGEDSDIWHSLFSQCVQWNAYGQVTAELEDMILLLCSVGKLLKIARQLLNTEDEVRDGVVS